MWTPTESAFCALFCLASRQRKEKEGATGKTIRRFGGPSPARNLSASAPALVKRPTIHDPCSPIWFSSILFACLSRRRSCQRLNQSTLVHVDFVVGSIMLAGLHLRLFATNPTTASLLPPCPEAPSRRIQMASELQVAAHRPSFRISLRMAACLGTPLGFVCLWVHVSQATSFCLSWDASRERMTTNLLPRLFQQVGTSRFPSATNLHKTRSRRRKVQTTIATVPFASPNCQNTSSFPS